MEEKELKVRKAKASDTKTLVSMSLAFNDFEETLDPEFKALEPGPAAGFRGYVRKCVGGVSGRFVFVAEIKEKIAGFIYCSEMERPSVFKVKRAGFVNDFFIAPEFRGKGVGKALMKAAEKEFKRRKLGWICLTALSNNEEALKAYKALGFEEFKKEMRKKI